MLTMKPLPGGQARPGSTFLPERGFSLSGHGDVRRAWCGRVRVGLATALGSISFSPGRAQPVLPVLSTHAG